MSYPFKICIPVPHTHYHLEVDTRKWDCRKELPHCHVTDKKVQLAKIYLDSRTFTDVVKDISNADQARILMVLDENMSELRAAYENNRKRGTG